MLRKLLLPVVAATLVAGCVTTDYGYRGGRGDYYYGQPYSEYRYHGGYYPYGAYPYGGYYGRYPYGAYGYPYYGYPYGGYYRYPYYNYPHGHPTYPRPPQPGDTDRDDRPAPWRNYDEIIRRRQGQTPTPSGEGMRPAMTMPRQTAPGPRNSGSRMEQVIRQAQQRQGERRRTEEP